MTRAALVVALVACGGGKAADAPATPAPAAQPAVAKRSTLEELEARIPKIVTAMDQLAKDLSEVKDDCPKIASVLRMWGSIYAVELDALWELKNRLTPAERERYEHDHDDDAKRLGPVFEASMATCQGDEEVEDALTVAGFRRVESLKQ